LEQTQVERPSFRFSRNQSIALVAACTVFGATAQMLIKTGAVQLQGTGPIAMLLNPYVFAGYSLYGLFTITLTLALRDGELSILYPVISLTYVWVTILSSLVFKEVLTITKVVGISVIVAGVAVLGMGDRKK
jgi:undecaprenyl phosphate-alpha-L-ara4N flippase subunit ArnE